MAILSGPRDLVRFRSIQGTQNDAGPAVFFGTGSPTDGKTAGTTTGYGVAGRGSLYINCAAAAPKIYVNVGTGSSYVTWMIYGSAAYWNV